MKRIIAKVKKAGNADSYLVLLLTKSKIRYQVKMEERVKEEVEEIENIKVDEKTGELMLEDADMGDLLVIDGKGKRVRGKRKQMLGKVDTFRYLVLDVLNREIVVMDREQVLGVGAEEWQNLTVIKGERIRGANKIKKIEEEELTLLTRDIERAERITQTGIIRDRGWTKEMIDIFLPEPLLVKNPHYATAAKMKLWRKGDVEDAERTDFFREYMIQRYRKK